MKVEMENTTPLAVVYGNGDLESGIARVLKKQHIRVSHLEKIQDVLPILEKPAYIFFFAENDVLLSNLSTQFEEAISTASRCGARLILVLV
ncbi:hypothetical protein HY310_02135, partial [Candidatus Microgenomates bacterium]|nr:hypothetical protein [Candidatus Microgenomates bacterium]